MDSILTGARARLQEAVDQGVTPGGQVAVSWRHGGVVACSVGALWYGPDAPPVGDETRYDLASITKVLVALTAVKLGRHGVVPLDAFWPDAEGTCAAGATMEQLLSHRAGMLAWAPFYEAVRPEEAGTPEARRAVWRAALQAPREAPGQARYSDLGYIVLGEALASVEGLGLDALVRRCVLEPLSLERGLHFRGVGPGWRDRAVAPTERCGWRGRVVQGEVHDENAYAMGGVAGHAGLFGTATALAALGRAALEALAGRSPWLSGETLEVMVRPREGGVHRLGWDGRSPEGSSAGTRMGPRTFGHLGFTGTSLWCDPDADVAVALVTNRVHPTRARLGIRELRQAVCDAVLEACQA